MLCASKIGEFSSKGQKTKQKKGVSWPHLNTGDADCGFVILEAKYSMTSTLFMSPLPNQRLHLFY